MTPEGKLNQQRLFELIHAIIIHHPTMLTPEFFTLWPASAWGTFLGDLYQKADFDNESVEHLLEQIDEPIDHFSADGAYDKTPVYEAVTAHSPAVDMVIPPQENAVENEKAATQRNRNLLEIKTHGRMQWQRARQYGRRNYSELAIQRYKRIIGDSLHAREWERQQQEAMLACGVLNKMTSLGMPQSYRSIDVDDDVYKIISALQLDMQ